MAILRPMSKKAKKGRPPRPPEEHRSRVVKTLVTEAEQEQLQAAATRAGRTLSDWLRWIGLREARSGAE